MSTSPIRQQRGPKLADKPPHRSDIFEQCPPETPHQLFCNFAIAAVEEQYAALLNDLSDEVSAAFLEAAATAAYAVLEAAQVSNDWRDVIKPALTKKQGGVQ